MTTYTMTGPDGKDYSIDGPAGATQEQVQAQLAQAHAQATTTPPQGTDQGAVLGGLQSAARAGTFGLSDVAAAGLGAGLSHLTDNPQTYAQTKGTIDANADATATAHPVATALGGVGGVVASTPLLAAAMPFKAALALRAGSKLANVARVTGTGALMGGEYGAASGAVKGVSNGDGVVGTAEDVAGGGATGALEGAAGGVAGAGVAAGAGAVKNALFSDAGQKSIALLSKAFNVTPTEMRAVYSKFMTDSGGRVPSMGELTDLNNRGEIRAMVGKNPILSATVAQAADDSAAALPGRLNKAVTQTLGNGEDAADLVTRRGATMDAAMTPIRDTAFPLAPEDVEFMRKDVLPNSGLTRLGRQAVHQSLDTGELTVGNADTLRQNLQARAQANPGEGFGELAQGITQMATDAVPEYGHALEGFANDSNYIDGHAHGLTGKTPGQTDNPGLIRALATPDGQAGYQSGITTRLSDLAFKNEGSASTLAKDLSGQSATNTNVGATFRPVQADALRDAAGAESKAGASLDAITPSNATRKAGVDPLQAGLAVASHGLGGTVLHGIKALAGVGMSDNVARVTAKYLTDPRFTQQGINLMARYGVNAAATRAMLSKVGKISAVATAVAGGQ